MEAGVEAEVLECEVKVPIAATVATTVPTRILIRDVISEEGDELGPSEVGSIEYTAEDEERFACEESLINFGG